MQLQRDFFFFAAKEHIPSLRLVNEMGLVSCRMNRNNKATAVFLFADPPPYPRLSEQNETKKAFALVKVGKK